MNTEPIYELRERLRAAAMAGTSLLSEVCHFACFYQERLFISGQVMQIIVELLQTITADLYFGIICSQSFALFPATVRGDSRGTIFRKVRISHAKEIAGWMQQHRGPATDAIINRWIDPLLSIPQGIVHRQIPEMGCPYFDTFRCI